MNKFSNYTDQQLKQLYADHKTLMSMAKFFKCSIELLRKQFIKRNIEYVKQINYNVNHNFFSEITEKSAYWLGFISADGNIDKNKPRIGITLKKTDFNHLVKFKNDLNCEAPVYTSTRIDKRPQFKTGIYHNCFIRFTSRQIKADLAKFTIVPNKSKILKFPEQLKEHPLVNHYIRGLIDGDGSIAIRDNCGFIFLCGTYDIVNNTKEILDKKFNLKGSRLRFSKSNGLWLFNLTRYKEVCEVLEWLYDGATTWLDRKKENADNIFKLIKREKIEIDTEFLKNIRSGMLAKQLGVSISTVNRRRVDNNLRIKKIPYIYNNLFDRENPSPLQYFLLGYIFINSSMTVKDNRLSITTTNLHILELIKEKLKYNAKIKKCRNTESQYCIFHHKKMADDLRYFNIQKGDMIIDEVLNSQYFKYFLLGMIEAKSHMGESNGRSYLNIIMNDVIFSQLKQTLIQHNIIPKTKELMGGKYRSLHLHRNQIRSLYEFIYDKDFEDIALKMVKLKNYI